MPEVARCHIQEIERHLGVGFRHVLKAAPLHQPYRRLYDGLRGKLVGATVLQPKNVSRKMESADLAASIGEELVGANRTINDLVDIIGRLRLPENLRAPFVFEFAREYPCP
jgi:hypothetical protein